jgi:16S rRNA (uracil1498-N3)-methyltransferase
LVLRAWKNLPRLYTKSPLSKDAAIALDRNQAYYLRHVLRRQQDDQILLWNGQDGEWRASLVIPSTGKTMQALCQDLTRPQLPSPAITLCFALLKQDALHFVLQKSTELGVTRFQPLLTDRAISRSLNHERALAIIIEAAEQAERLDLPQLETLLRLEDMLVKNPVMQFFACMESGETLPALQAFRQASPTESSALLVGPEGGWTDKEMALLRNHDRVVPIALGANILRAETAALTALAGWQILRHEN